WVWLTHDDADHTGNIERIFQLAPNARLVTNAFSAMRMATWWQVPLDRVHAIRPGDKIEVGDRTLRAVSPPVYDNPLSIGAVDESTGALFSVDAFGALLPEASENVADVPTEALAGGMVGWATSDSPWLHTIDRELFSGALERVRSLQPTHVFSSHLPAASGASLDHFLQVLETVPDADPFVPPNAEEFAHLVAALTAQPQPPVAAT
ncbi:MAG: MBL fold metallo-hydrolase, partial [Actinomycetota bacterium]|nr:MBL fold metallo-hydrolase [Actinomycetota bacterium]